MVVLHGRNETGCPIGSFDSPTWPCFARENRYDIGLRHVVRSLAERGIVAVAPSLGGAFTAGWGEPNDADRWPRIVNRTLGQVAREAAEGGGRFGVQLQGRVNLRRIGLLGHSLSGHHSVRAGRRRADKDSPADIARGRGPISALFLLTPVAQGAVLRTCRRRSCWPPATATPARWAAPTCGRRAGRTTELARSSWPDWRARTTTTSTASWRSWVRTTPQRGVHAAAATPPASPRAAGLAGAGGGGLLRRHAPRSAPAYMATPRRAPPKPRLRPTSAGAPSGLMRGHLAPTLAARPE